MNYEVEYYQLNEKNMTKKWYESATIWFNVIITILGIIAGFQDAKLFAGFSEIFIAITIIGNVILRVWSTAKPIK